MGQKVNPKGLRLGVLYNWNSRWFFSRKKLYKRTLLSDIKIRENLMQKLRYASVTQVDIERAINKITVIIHSVKPGMIIGRGGKGLEEVKRLIAADLKSGAQKQGKETKVDIKIEPVKKPFTNAYFTAQTVAEKLARSFPHRGVIHSSMNRVMETGARGVRIQLGGRIGGAEISRREKYFKSTIPTSTIREDIDYASFPALTKSGYVGVKVWICR